VRGMTVEEASNSVLTVYTFGPTDKENSCSVEFIPGILDQQATRTPFTGGSAWPALQANLFRKSKASDPNLALPQQAHRFQAYFRRCACST